MTDKQKTLVSLTLVLETCNAALSSISHHQSGLVPPEVDRLYNDLLSLLSLLDMSTTKLALTLKPSSPTYSASLKPLKDISSHVAALAHCTNLFDPITHGATLIREVVVVVTDVVVSIRSLAETFLALERSESARCPNSEYLVKVGAVHETIDKARAISKSNRIAVRKKWAEDNAVLDDGLLEVGEMIEAEETDAASENGGASDSIMDDNGWDELGLCSGNKMEMQELARTKTVHNVLRLATLLHKRVDLDVLSSSMISPTDPALDALLRTSSTLLAAADDLASTLYPPQETSSIRTQLHSFVQAAEAVQIGVRDLLSQPRVLLTKLEDLSLTENASEIKEREDPMKWFDTCFDQVYEISKTLMLTLGQENGCA